MTTAMVGALIAQCIELLLGHFTISDTLRYAEGWRND
jgi:hypothetical protein